MFIFCPIFFIYFLVIYCIFFPKFLDILSDFASLLVWNCPFRNCTFSHLSIWSENVSINCEAWGRRNSSISRFQWAISAISELLFVSVFVIFFPDFLAILLDVTGLCVWNCLFRESMLLYLSTSTETLYLSNRSLRSTISKVWVRRNSSISWFWWAISAIRELLFV